MSAAWNKWAGRVCGPGRANTLRIAKVMGERAQMQGNKLLQVTVAGKTVHHPFWLASIQDPCISGLDMLARRGHGGCVESQANSGH